MFSDINEETWFSYNAKNCVLLQCEELCFELILLNFLML